MGVQWLTTNQEKDLGVVRKTQRIAIVRKIIMIIINKIIKVMQGQ